MALSLKFISVIIPIETIEKCRDIGGFKGILEIQKEWIGKKVLYDKYLYKDSAMGSYDIDKIIEFWEKQGLTPTKTQNGKTYWKDLAVVDFVSGLTLPCDWLELEEEEPYRYAIAWLKGKPRGDVVSAIHQRRDKIAQSGLKVMPEKSYNTCASKTMRNFIKENWSNFLETFIILLLFLSPIAVFFFYADTIEDADVPGLIVVGILLILFFWQVIRHGSKSPKEAMKELEENQKRCI